MLVSGDSQLATKKQINLLDHCVFCLRRRNSLDDNEKSDKFIETLSSCIPLEVSNQVTKHFLNTIGREEWTGFVEAPTICSICGEDVRRIHELLSDLAKASSAIQHTIEWAGREGRVRDFLTELRAVSGDEDVKRSTVKFLVQLGHLEIEEETQLETIFEVQNDVKKEENSCEEQNEKSFHDCDEVGVDFFDDTVDEDDMCGNSVQEGDGCDTEAQAASVITSSKSVRKKSRNNGSGRQNDWNIDYHEGEIRGVPNTTSVKSRKKRDTDQGEKTLRNPRSGVKEEDLIEEPKEEFQYIDEAGVPNVEDAPDWGDDYLEDGSESNDNEIPEVSIKTKTNSSRSKKRKNVPDDDEYLEGVEGRNEGPLNKASFKSVRQKKPRKQDRDREDCPRATNGAKSMRCDFCREYVPLKELCSHVRTHAGDYAQECPNPYCYAAYASTTGLKIHLRPFKNKTCASFLKVDLDACQLCGYKASSQSTLYSHLIDIHESTTSKQLGCPVSNCPEQFSLRQTVSIHIQRQHRVTPDISVGLNSSQKCPFPACDKYLPKARITEHLVDDHRAPLESIVSCKYCPFAYLSKDQLVDHLQVHLRTGVSVVCDMCPGEEVKFARTKDLREHYFKFHQVGEFHRCKHCDKSSLDASEINSHMRKVHKLDRFFNPVPGVKCDLCPEHVTRQYFRSVILLKHKINEHGAEPFRCQFCPRAFSLQRRRDEHELEHKGMVKPKPPKGSIKCDIPGCGKEFSSKKRLRVHMKAIKHAGPGSVLCGECGRGFTTNYFLSKHVEVMHSEEKPTFVCDTCGDVFHRRTNLDAHVKRIHTNPMVLNCHMCNRRFCQRRALARHLAHLKPDGTCLGEKNFREDWRKKRQEKLSHQLNT